jgi:hypothetical protein
MYFAPGNKTQMARRHENNIAVSDIVKQQLIILNISI